MFLRITSVVFKGFGCIFTFLNNFVNIVSINNIITASAATANDRKNSYKI